MTDVVSLRRGNDRGRTDAMHCDATNRSSCSRAHQKTTTCARELHALHRPQITEVQDLEACSAGITPPKYSVNAVVHACHHSNLQPSVEGLPGAACAAGWSTHDDVAAVHVLLNGRIAFTGH